MKSIFSVVIIAVGIIYLSSCSNKDAKTSNLTLVPSADSVTKGCKVQIFFNNDTFNLSDLVVTGSPVETIFASDSFNINDSVWRAKLLITDFQLKRIALNLTLVDTTSPYNDGTGNYYITDNASTFTDYSSGSNKTYTVVAGSYINITRTHAPVTGSMYLNLYYNHQQTSATGTFVIY